MSSANLLKFCPKTFLNNMIYKNLSYTSVHINTNRLLNFENIDNFFDVKE